MFKSQEKLIAEIHSEFDTAQDRLLSQAKEILAAKKTDHLSPEERQAERLKNIGFTSVPLVKKAEVITKKKEESRKQVVESAEQAELINYYKTTYPFLKFLTEPELDRICAKYNLIHAPVANFIGEVPDKNLRDIENAQRLKGEDSLPKLIRLICGEYKKDKFNALMKLMGKPDAIFTQEEINDWCARAHGRNVESWTINGANNTWLFCVNERLFQSNYYYNYQEAEIIDKSGLFIAAPAKDFNLKGLEKKSQHGFFSVFKTEVKDPIVFRYVRGGIQVLTKWSIEGEDPSLVLPINN